MIEDKSKRKVLKDWQKVGSKVKVTKYHKAPRIHLRRGSWGNGENPSPRKVVDTFTGTLKKRVKSDASYRHAGKPITFYKYTVETNGLDKKTRVQLVKKLASKKLPREMIEKILPKTSTKTIIINEGNALSLYKVGPLRSSSGSF